MSPAEILSGIQEIMREYFDDDGLVIRRETTARDVEAWDSLNHINIIIGIEQRFKVKFTTSEVEALHNVGDLVDTIEGKTAGR